MTNFSATPFALAAQGARSAVIFFLAAFALAGCHSARLPDDGAPVTLLSLKEVTYDTSVATLKVQGQLNTGAFTDLTVIEFHAIDGCADAPAGQGLLRDFVATGLQAKVPSTGNTRIYLRTNTDSHCYFVTEYDPLHAPPPPPTLSQTVPVSPSRLSFTPALFGTTSGITSQLRFFDDSACAHSVGTGTPTDFGTIGIQVTLAANTASSIYAQSVEPFGNASACTLVGSYTHNSIAPPAPTYKAVSPASPNNVSTTPLISGTVSANTASVAFFSDAACTTLIGQGANTDFTGSGVQITAGADSSTLVYGQATDTAGNVSACTYEMTYVNKTTPPGAPAFVSTTPSSPTRLTIYPKVIGTISTADTVSVTLYNDAACGTQIGFGTAAQFQGTGVIGSAAGNATIHIFARANDAAGNHSDCTYMTDFTNDTIPPDPPAFSATVPTSPNNKSITPLFFGSAVSLTKPITTVQFFDDSACTHLLASGTPDAFSTIGITVPVVANATTMVYANILDWVGNASDCTLMTNYQHSTLPAGAPAFTKTLPSSPSNVSNTPKVIGTTVSNIVNLNLYSDPGCTMQIGTGSKFNFTTSGITATVPTNATTDIYAVAFNVFGNASPCTYMTTYIHDNTQPPPPTFIATSPPSPTNLSTSPVVTGTALLTKDLAPVTVSFYDSVGCTNRIGTGSSAVFAATGIIVNVPPDQTTSIYARTIDAATNRSSCTYMTDYTHKDIPPGKPTFLSTTPKTPSYTQKTALVGSSTYDTYLVNFYDNPACTGPTGTHAPTGFIGSATKSTFETTGFVFVAYENATTTVYAQAEDIETNVSPCTHMVDYVHNDIGPANPQAQENPDGSISLSWTPDLTANPIPSYIVKRSLRSGGPYTVIAAANLGNTFTDYSVSNNTTYYYVIAASNNTGTSFDSVETSATVGVATPLTPTAMTATPGPAQVTVNWGGMPTAMYYNLYRSTQPGGPYTLLVGNLNSTLYIDKSVTNDTAYYYVAAGMNPWGLSPYSNEASAVPKDVPPPPTGLVIIPVPQGNLLTWSAPAYYDKFNVKRSGNSGSEATIATVSGTSYLDTFPVITAGSYVNPNYYYVTATWDVQESMPSNEVVYGHIAGPNVTANAGNSEIQVTWSAPQQAVDYEIYRSAQDSGPFTLLASGLTSTQYNDLAVTNGTTYYYQVRTRYTGSVYGRYSSVVSAIPFSNPTAPSGLTLTVANNSPILYWSAPSTYNSFNVYRASALAGPYTLYANSISATYVDTSPAQGMNYYKVSALWGSFETAKSNAVSFRNGVPLSITATTGNTSISLGWTAVSGANFYQLQRSTVSGGPYSILVSPTGTNYVDSSVTVNKGYYYVVDAHFVDGTTGQFSSEVGAMAGTGKVPSGVTVTNTTSGSVTLAWDKVSGAQKYGMYKSTAPSGPYAFVNPTTTSLNGSIFSLNANTQYYFTVASIVNGVTGTTGPPVSAYTNDIPSSPLASPGFNSVGLMWPPTTGALTYTVLRSSDGVNFTTIASGLTTTSYTDPAAVNGTLYFYEVAASYPGGVTLTSTPSTPPVTPGIVPLTPSGLTVDSNSSGTSLALSWGSVVGASTYNVYVSAVSGGPYGTPALSTSTNLNNVLIGLTPAVPQYIVVTALNGSMETGYSPQLAVIPNVSPPAPTGVASSTGIVSVTWNSVASASKYDLQRAPDQTHFTTLVSGITGTSFVDTTAASGSPVVYRYLPYDTNGVTMAPSLSSAIITPGTQPLSPSSLTAIASLSNSVNVSWVQAPNASSYNVYRSTTSGGPYTFLANVANSQFSYTDGTVSPGSTYFYVATTVNVSGVESPNSNEANVRLISAPASLTASTGPNVINLSWSAVGGASSYNVMRGTASGGPYGLLAAGLGATTYADTSIQNATDYFYVVTANFPGGYVSLNSPEASAIAFERMSLQVPIELTDESMNSDTAPLAFDRTQTSFDPTAYDGTVSYFFQVVATNSDPAPQSVYLVDSAGTVRGTVSVPGSTAAPTRIRVTWTPNASGDTYRLQLAGTPSYGELIVYSARILVNQVQASKTRIYVPLLSSNAAASSADLTAAVESTAAQTYGDLPSATIYLRDTSVLADLDEYNPWELETLVSAPSGEIGAVALYDRTQGSIVDDTESLFPAPTGIIMTSSPFSEGVNNFDPATNEGDEYSISLRCVTTCASGSITLYKAGLWINLQNISKTQVYYRDSRGMNPVISSGTLDIARSILDLSLFSHPTAFFQAVATPPSIPDSLTVDLMTAGTSDSGTSGLTTIPSASLLFNNPIPTKTRMRSGGITFTNGDRFLTNVTPTGGTSVLTDSTVIINAVR